jgi:hypothetical protein
VGAAPTNKLHGSSPCDLKRDALYNGPIKNFSDEREVLNADYSSNSKRQEKNSPICVASISRILRYPQIYVDKLFITAVKLLCGATIASHCLKHERRGKKIAAPYILWFV